MCMHENSVNMKCYIKTIHFIDLKLEFAKAELRSCKQISFQRFTSLAHHV